EDILEEIVGEIADEHDLDLQGVRQEADGSVVVDGTVPIRDLNRALDWNLPDDHVTTIAGLVIHEAQTIPEEKQAFTFHGMRFLVLERDKNRIVKLRIRPATGPERPVTSAPALPEQPAPARGRERPRRDDPHAEMSLAAPVERRAAMMAAMTGMQVTLVDHFQPFGPEPFAEPQLDLLCDGCGQRPFLSPYAACGEVARANLPLIALTHMV